MNQNDRTRTWNPGTESRFDQDQHSQTPAFAFDARATRAGAYDRTHIETADAGGSA